MDKLAIDTFFLRIHVFIYFEKNVYP